MNFFLVLIFLSCFSVGFNFPQLKELPVCSSDYCHLPNCKCSDTYWSGPVNNTQFVVLSIEDALSNKLHPDFLNTFITRTNPDGCPISGTFFVPHEFTDYSVVNKLYNLGFEIGSHSITKNFSQEYWRSASVPTLISEFADQRTIISKFANISEDEIRGVRVPQLEIGRNTFKALHEAGFAYDASWPTLQQWTFYPYSLDYSSRQQCHTRFCQVEATPGLWEMPIIDWINDQGISCNSLHSCAVEKNLYEWMKSNYNQIKKSGAPIALRVSYSWFISVRQHASVLAQFLNYVRSDRNTYIVSYKQLFDWTKNPTPKFSSCQKVVKRECDYAKNACKYNQENDIERYMGVCGKCPPYYPWINNPFGDKPNN